MVKGCIGRVAHCDVSPELGLAACTDEARLHEGTTSSIVRTITLLRRGFSGLLEQEPQEAKVGDVLVAVRVVLHPPEQAW